jgi:hypothetical protein
MRRIVVVMIITGFGYRRRRDLHATREFGIFVYLRLRAVDADLKLAEWSIAAVLETANPQGFGGSNPSLTAKASHVSKR